MKRINEIIRELREHHNLNQDFVASEVLGIAQQTYSSYELGHSELPVRHLIRLSGYYQVTADYLLGITDFKGSPEKLNSKLYKNTTIGEFVSDVCELDTAGKRTIVEFGEYLKSKHREK